MDAQVWQGEVASTDIEDPNLHAPDGDDATCAIWEFIFVRYKVFAFSPLGHSDSV